LGSWSIRVNGGETENMELKINLQMSGDFIMPKALDILQHLRDLQINLLRGKTASTIYTITVKKVCLLLAW
jgi:hypothetical protein